MKFIITETKAKYFAGLIDADGCYYFQRNAQGYLRGCFTISQSSLGKLAVEELAGLTEKRVTQTTYKTKAGDEKIKYTVLISSREDLKSFNDRLLKFLVVKGTIAKFVSDKVIELKNTKISEKDFELLQSTAKGVREFGGAVKPRNFVSSAWVAGFLDGDGNYSIKRGAYCHAWVSVSKREKVQAIKFLVDKFGGSHSKTGTADNWYLGLGKGKRQLAVKFLKQMRKHSIVKQDKIEMMLNIHSSSGTD
jgi:hypothetical protein